MSRLFTLILAFAMSNFAHADATVETVYKLKGSVAKVHSITKAGGHGVGSAVVVAENLVATNCHVLANTAGINITAMGETYVPVGVREDWRHDVCILRFMYLPLKPVELGDESKLEYEQSIFTIGFPGGPPKPQSTFGKVKALYPLDDGYVIRTSASFVLGASGSPIMDDSGRLIGLDTFKSPGRNGYFYGVPVKWIKALLDAPENEKVLQAGTPFWDSPEDKMPYFMRVVTPLKTENWPELKALAEAWLKQEPGSIEAQYYIAYAQEKLHDIPAASALYQKILAQNPKHTSSLIGLADIAKLQGKDNERQMLAMQIKALDADAAEDILAQ